MPEPEDPFVSTRMTLGEHLEELRRRLFIGIATIFVILIAAWFVKDKATAVVLRPYYVMTAMLEEHYTAEAEERLAADPELERSEFFVELAPGKERLRFFQDTRMQAVAPGEPFFFILKICFFFALFLGVVLGGSGVFFALNRSEARPTTPVAYPARLPYAWLENDPFLTPQEQVLLNQLYKESRRGRRQDEFPNADR